MRVVPFLCCVFVIVSIFNGVEVEANKKEVCCKNYRPVGNVSIPAVRDDLYRKYIKKYWTTSPALALLSSRAKKLIDRLLKSVDAASPKLLLSFRIFTATSSLSLMGLKKGDRIPLCHRAAIVNASVKFADCGYSGQLAVQTITKLRDGWSNRCLQIPIYALRASGCKDLPVMNPVVPSETTGCYENGLVYDIELALMHYGRSLPCPMARRVVKLYRSHRFVDRLIAVHLIAAITDLGLDFFGAIDAADSLELSQNILNPVDRKRCCDARKKRLVELCNKPTPDLDHVIRMYSYS